MKRIIFITIGVLLIALYAIYEQHRQVEAEWGEWKELTLDGANPSKPGICFYCEYIKPLIKKCYE